MIQHVLFVCTGNICRSPLAASLLERALKERGLEVTVTSAGTGAWDGAPASEGAYLVGLERGLDLSGHRARLLTRELVERADLILTMARHHRARVDELGGEGRVFVLVERSGSMRSTWRCECRRKRCPRCARCRRRSAVQGTLPSRTRRQSKDPSRGKRMSARASAHAIRSGPKTGSSSAITPMCSALPRRSIESERPTKE